MGRAWPLIPKGRAMALNLTPEYDEGTASNKNDKNPYDFFDEYEKHYAWDIGSQKRGR